VQRERVIQDGRQRIFAEVAQTIRGSGSFDDLEKKISEIEQSSFVPLTERKALLINSWEGAVKRFLEEGIIDSAAEGSLVAFKQRFSLSTDDLDHNGAHTKLVQAAVLRDVLNGTVPQRFSFSGNLPVNLQKSEQLVWAFPNSKYLEDKVRREYVGGSRGASIRVMKGVYYHVGAFKGHSVEHTESVHVDTGWVFITSKHIYFAGPRKSLRLPYAKIVSFDSFANGIGVTRDAVNAKPQFFLTGDGWFTYNLVTNLSKL
jgi:hypothetical protein